MVISYFRHHNQNILTSQMNLNFKIPSFLLNKVETSHPPRKETKAHKKFIFEKYERQFTWTLFYCAYCT